MREQSRSNFRWIIVLLLFLITVINYIDRSSISFAIEIIEQQFHLNKAQIGLVLGAFGIGYLITTFLGGIAADRFGARYTLVISIFFWGVTSILTGISSGFIMVFIARALLGLAEGPCFPSMTRAVSDWLNEKERSQALSFALISVPLSLAIGGPIASQLIVWFDWRGAYYSLAIIAFIWLPVWWYFFRDKPQDSTHVNQQELNYIHEQPIIQSKLCNETNPWSVLLRNKTLLVNNWAFFVFGYYLFFFMTWLPTFLKSKYHLDLTQIGIYSIAPWLLAAGFMWIVGLLSDMVFRKTKCLRLSRSYPIFISQLLSALAVIPAAMQDNVFWALLFISLAVGFAMSANAAYYAVNIDIAKERAGTALGIMDALFALAGFISPVITGFIVQFSGHYEVAFILLGGLALSSSLLTMLFHNKSEHNNRATA